jgi:hypothetical protein
MTEVSEFETRTDRRNRLHSQVNGWYSEQSEADVKSFVAHETWASLQTDVPGILPIADQHSETQQSAPYDGLLAGMDKWGFVYGLLKTPTSKGHVIKVETPSEHWSWCGDPALTRRVCLKERISILSRFGG